jgi:hypothetical protein
MGGQPDFRFPADATFPSPKRPYRLWDPPNLLFGGVPRREHDHFPPSNAKVKNEWSYISTPLQALVARTWTLPLLLGTGQVTVGSRGHGDVTYHL